MRTVLLAIAIAGISWTGWASVPTAKVEQGELKGSIEDGLTVRGAAYWRSAMAVSAAGGSLGGCAKRGKVCAAVHAEYPRDNDE